jgi:hypothetical protein
METADAAPYKTFSARPIKDARPFVVNPSYATAEAQCFDMLSQHWNYGQISAQDRLGSNGRTGVSTINDSTSLNPLTSGEAGIYFARYIEIGDRQGTMVDAAKAVLRNIANFICKMQRFGPLTTQGQAMAIDTPSWDGTYNATAFAPASAIPLWGAIHQFTSAYSTVETLTAAACGEALWRAWRIFSDERYRRAAIACATFCVNMSRSDAFVSSGSMVAGPSTIRWNRPTDSINPTSATVITAVASTSSQSTARVLSLLRIIRTDAGNITVGSAANATYTTGTVTTLDDAITAISGAFTGPLGGVIGLSSSTPRQTFSLQNGTWTEVAAGSGYYVSLVTFAHCMRGLFDCSGLSSQLSSVLNWMLSATSNATYELASEYDENTMLQGSLGKYSPSTTGLFSTEVYVRDFSNVAMNTNTSGACSPSITGLIGDIAVAAGLSSVVKNIKDGIDSPIRLGTTATQNGSRWAQRYSRCGLSRQIVPYQTPRAAFEIAAAARLYRTATNQRAVT